MSRSTPRFLASLLNRPHLIEPAAGAAVLAVLAPGVELVDWGGMPENPGRTARDYKVVGTVAVIPVVGELVHRGTRMQASSGLTSYTVLADQIAAAMADPGVGALLFEVDSPGGQGTGCLALADRIRTLRGRKPLWGMVNEVACSAAYALVSACDKVFVTQDSRVGSIGVVAYHTDISEGLKRQGVAVTYIHAGARKIDGVPALPLSDEARKRWQADVDATYARFCATVAANRPALTTDAVRATEAAVFRGPEAVQLGLADGVSTIEDVIMKLNTGTAPEGARFVAGGTGQTLETPKESPEGGGTAGMALNGDQPGTGGVPTPALAVAEACTTAGFPELTAPLLRAGATMATVTATLADAKTILQDGLKVGQEANARRLIAAGVGAADAKAILWNASATADQMRITDATQPGTPAKPGGPVIDHKAIYARMNGLKG